MGERRRSRSPSSAPGRPRTGAQLVRRRVPASDRTVRQRVRVTALVPTILDAAVSLGLAEGAALFDAALQRRQVTLDALRHGLIRRSGRPGTPPLRRLMALAEDSPTPTCASPASSGGSSSTDPAGRR